MKKITMILSVNNQLMIRSLLFSFMSMSLWGVDGIVLPRYQNTIQNITIVPYTHNAHMIVVSTEKNQPVCTYVPKNINDSQFRCIMPYTSVSPEVRPLKKDNKFLELENSDGNVELTVFGKKIKKIVDKKSIKFFVIS